MGISSAPFIVSCGFKEITTSRQVNVLVWSRRGPGPITREDEGHHTLKSRRPLITEHQALLQSEPAADTSDTQTTAKRQLSTCLLLRLPSPVRACGEQIILCPSIGGLTKASELEEDDD
ncbi:hypothetical protein NHX12_025194 [Muraenolepis orangiensis]|uniref:Uncharacterized protein n=1 Tax=Muraenolepis orangiensis TaxID=630683 RepID=A0A9Q0EJP2_9TELE|nr:hypothetical protein NHX12_025194 [Muraenolepis orangiensis]